MAIHGLVVVGSGLYRWFSADGGIKGLLFGVAMGGLSLFAASLLQRGVQRAGRGMAIGSLLLTGGWFSWEVLVRSGFAEADPRHLIVLGATLVAAIGLLRSKDATAAAGSTVA